MLEEKLCHVKYKIKALSNMVDEKIFQQFGFRTLDMSFDKIVNYLHTPKDASSLAVTRILFGISMLFDIAGERGGTTLMERWGTPTTCHFALLPFIKALPTTYIVFVYSVLWFGAVGIALGCKYRVSAAAFTVSYWYLFIVEKSYWNNHSYLFGLVATLLSFTNAHCYWSVDAIIYPSIKNEVVPYWNYFILKYQFFILYFVAGLKKGTAEWLSGYSVQNLSAHWVFFPFKFFLTVPQIDYFVVHWFVFLFDLTVAFWMMWSRTRHVAMLFCALFHLMNSRLFSIGMFPWVCLATMPLFYPFDWPKTVGNHLIALYLKVRNGIKNEENVQQSMDNDVNEVVEQDLESEEQNSSDNVFEEKIENDDVNVDEDNGAMPSSDNSTNDTEMLQSSDGTDIKLQKSCHGKDKNLKILTVVLIFFYVLTQAFLPFSHFITKGYNNWTKGLYGYSWDMMVHTWDTYSVVITVVDNENNNDFFIHPYLFSPNDRWTRHGDMMYQYAHCLKDNLETLGKYNKGNPNDLLSKNLSIYADIWISLNGRFTQRIYDPHQDLLKVTWSPFEPMSYLMPLLDEALSWRSVLQDVRQEVHSWGNSSDVIFLADFPGYTQQNFITADLINVTLTVLEGTISYDSDEIDSDDGRCYKLNGGSAVKVQNQKLLTTVNIGETPAYYMYTYVNLSTHNVPKANSPDFPMAEKINSLLIDLQIFIQLLLTDITAVFIELLYLDDI